MYECKNLKQIEVPKISQNEWLCCLWTTKIYELTPTSLYWSFWYPSLGSFTVIDYTEPLSTRTLQLSESHSVLTLHLCEKPACAFNREQKNHAIRAGSNAVGDHISGSSSITYWSMNTDSHQVTNIVVHVSSIRLLKAREHVGSLWSLFLLATSLNMGSSHYCLWLIPDSFFLYNHLFGLFDLQYSHSLRCCVKWSVNCGSGN